ncbi:MAG: hypothetical protein D6782_05755 [Alphaproteobacteria bacterium]|nr:MAG: hypothetical protein D6782_05755 [Alphaproteobacteria bacterium]
MLKTIAKRLVPARAVERYRVWEFRQNLSPLARRVLAEDRRGLTRRDPGIQPCIDAALGWLCRAQDKSASQDGGVARDFSLLRGWNASYPETTGYIVPTMIAAGDAYDRPALLERARRMLDWLTAIQLDGGGFQGGTIGQTPVVPVTFNTGQILIGLAAGAARFGDVHYHEAMHRAAAFLRDSQDDDGCWRRHPTPFAMAGDKAYETHVAWGLFEAERVAPGEGYGQAGLRQVRWALTRQAANGWFADNCLNQPHAPLTHTIGYALRGLIEAYRLASEEEPLAAALRTADALLACIDSDGRIAGRLDRHWQPAVPWVCLTGTAQIAACWWLLGELCARSDYFAAAKRANAFVRRTVKLEGDADIVGGVKGAFPVDGDYAAMEYPNWAAKFFIDAQMLEQRLG